MATKRFNLAALVQNSGDWDSAGKMFTLALVTAERSLGPIIRPLPTLEAMRRGRLRLFRYNLRGQTTEYKSNKPPAGYWAPNVP